MIILAVLVVLSLSLGFFDNRVSDSAKGVKIFAVPDTSAVRLIKIQNADETIELQKKEEVWILNQQYKAEQNIVRVLLAILKDTEALRNVAKNQADAVVELINQKGALVEIYDQRTRLTGFRVAGNDNKTVSYVLPEGAEIPAMVQIPGYESYVAGIFEIPENDWRDRTILSTNWRTLQKLEVSYAQFPEYDFMIEFKDNFLKIHHIQALDTAAMMDYIGQFAYLQADKFLDKSVNTRYDSLLQTPETVTMRFYDINPANSKTIRFYPMLPDDPMMLGFVEEDEQMAIFQARRIQSWFAVKEDFVGEK